jgi:hypothetical protein
VTPGHVFELRRPGFRYELRTGKCPTHVRCWSEQTGVVAEAEDEKTRAAMRAARERVQQIEREEGLRR